MPRRPALPEVLISPVVTILRVITCTATRFPEQVGRENFRDFPQFDDVALGEPHSRRMPMSTDGPPYPSMDFPLEWKRTQD